MEQQKTAIRSLGEIALRVVDLDVMAEFYENVIRLELIRRDSNMAFFKIAAGFEGHTQILALFDRSVDSGYTAPDSARTTVDHLAFSISLSDYDDEHQRLTDARLKVTTAEHAWVKWRSLYVHDPEDNVVELVCFDPAIGTGLD